MVEPKEKLYSNRTQPFFCVRTWKEMANDIICSRNLIARLIWRDISVRYRQSLFGYLWALALPMITVSVFAFLASKRVLPIGQTPIPYPVYAIWGIVLWQLFSGTLSSSTRSLTTASSLVTKINFPKEALVLASVGQPLFDFSIKLLLVAAFMYFYDVPISFGTLAVPLIVFFVLLLAVGLGFFLSVFNLVTRDVGNVVSMFVSVGMFAAPILYPPPVSSPFYLVNILNPFSPLLIASQDLIAFGELRHGSLLWPALGFSITVFLVGWRTFRITIRRVAEQA